VNVQRWLRLRSAILLRPPEAALVVAAVLARLAFRMLTGFVADDAFITYRYATNLAAGHGFVYNPGERVLGTTTPLFTLLLAGPAALGFRPEDVALVAALASAGLTAVLIYRWARSWGFGAWAMVPAVAFVLWPRSLAADMSGLETACFTLFVTAAFYMRVRRRPAAAIASAGLAALTRPEGLWLLLLLGAEALWRGRGPRSVRALWWPAAVLLPWALFCALYFGTLLPTSVSGKLALYSRTAEGSLLHRAVYLMAWHHPFGWVLTAAALAGGYWLVRSRDRGRLEILWLAGMLGFYTVVRTHLFFWYVAPLYPVFLLLGAAALPLARERIAWRPVGGRTALAAVVTAAVVALTLGNVSGIMVRRAEEGTLLAIHRTIGIYLERVAAPGDLVAAEDIGYIGYWSGCRILDRDGLVSPSVHEYNRRGDYLGAVLGSGPDWVVTDTQGPTSGFVHDPRFLARYKEQRTFAAGGREYALFRRSGV
jgi:hypothetical protein